MPDKRFFKEPERVKISELARHVGADFKAVNDDVEISSVAPLDRAQRQDLSFFDNIKYRQSFEQTKAGACVVHPDFEQHAPKDVSLILSKNPYKTYATLAQFLYPEDKPKAHISQSATVDRSSTIGKGCIIEDYVVIKQGVEIGDHTWIQAGAVIDKNVLIGKNCWIGANCVVSHSIIGDHVRLYPGACVGQDGFGFAIDPAGFVKVPQLGRVIIEDSVEVGANTTIDRGAGPDTVIGTGTWIDNLVQIGHNVRVGRCCVIVSQVGISGSTVLEDYVVIGGQVGIAGHLNIGKGARIGAKSGVMRDIPPGQEHLGIPSQPIKSFMKQVALLKKMVKNK